jgi:hypothetical protein
MAKGTESTELSLRNINFDHNASLGRHSKDELVQRVDLEMTEENASQEPFTQLDEKKILRKMDLRLLPILTVLYLMSFLDRGNIGNAKIEGLSVDLHLSGMGGQASLNISKRESDALSRSAV